jgi:membrane fusion protein, protease secretion system
LMFTALNQAQTPTAQGEVLVVSPDRIVDERTGVPYYRMQTSIDMTEMPSDVMNLRHGMPVDVFVKTGERTLISYLLKPLSDRMRSGMREN